jgi:hypothetical protein
LTRVTFRSLAVRTRSRPERKAPLDFLGVYVMFKRKVVIVLLVVLMTLSVLLTVAARR